MKDVMVDIETLGTLPGSAILSIGAVAFDADTGEMGDEMLVKISVENSMMHGLVMDPKTILWWLKQSEDARNEAFSGELGLPASLEIFGQFIVGQSPDRVWAKPPSFDLVILEAAHKALGYQAPWHYRSPRCVRTIMDVAGFEYGHTLPAHCALDDAKAQAGMVIESFAKLRQSAPSEAV